MRRRPGVWAGGRAHATYLPAAWRQWTGRHTLHGPCDSLPPGARQDEDWEYAPSTVAVAGKTSPRITRRGRGIAVRIQLRKIAGNCGKIAVPYPNLPQPEGVPLHRGHTWHPQAREGNERKAIAGKLRKNCGKLRISTPPPLAELGHAAGHV